MDATDDQDRSATRAHRTAPNSLPPVRLDQGDRLARWLASGGCQAGSGAFCAWRSADTGKLAFEYPEITGYALTLLARSSESDEIAQVAARRAADWLLARFAEGDLSARRGWDGNAVYSFDLGMIATGLLRFGAVSGRRRYSTWGFTLVNMLRDQVGLDGDMPAVSRRHGAGSARPGEWSTEGFAHLLKLVQCFLLAESTGLRGAGDAADAIVERSRSYQFFNGRFVTQPRDSVTMLHPHLYAAEGLWIYGQARHDEEALARSRAALLWAWRHQLPSGGLPRAVVPRAGVGGSRQPEQVDVTAQAVRLAIVHDLPIPRLAEAVDRLRGLAVAMDDAAALPYQPEASEMHHNAWASMFGAQALQLARDPEARLDWRDLV